MWKFLLLLLKSSKSPCYLILFSFTQISVMVKYFSTYFLKSGSSVWRNTTVEAFSISSREEDDEEAIKWAALEKLPTYDRLRKGILMSASRGVISEVDIENLGVQERKQLLERLVKAADEDNEKFLWKLKSRIER